MSMVILAIILAMVLGLGAILFGQIRTIRGMGSSVVALYAADAGIERVLDVYYRGEDLAEEYESNDFVNSSYKVTVYCCHHSNEGCDWDPRGENACPLGLEESRTCQASEYCIRSVGKANEGTDSEAQRAIEARLFSVD